MSKGMAGTKARIGSWFKGLEPKRKRQVVLMATASAGLIFMIAVASITPDKRAVQGDGGSKKRTVAPPNLLQTETEGMGLDSVNTDVRQVQGELQAMKDELDRLRRQNENGVGMPPVTQRVGPPDEAAPSPATSPSNPDEALRAMRDDIVSSPAYQGAPPGTSMNPTRPSAGTPSTARSTTPRPGPGPNAPPASPPAAPTMRVVRGKVADVAPPAPPPIARDVYIPTGSILTGVLLNGLDAPTGRNAQSQPVPVVVRLKHEAILPSQYRSDVREAFVLAAGFGDLSSERAYLRAERLSMILRDGRVIDIPIKMAAVGSDGKTGVRGTVVSKQGALIAKALVAGTAEGISKAFGGNNYSGFGRDNDLPESRDLMVSGIGGGTSSALDRVASYFLQQAEAMYPVVEIAAGKQVSFILLEGTDLSTRTVEESEDEREPVAAQPDTSSKAS